jgi:Protein of unknown function (DUF3631)
MMDINIVSNAELDQFALDQDAQQGKKILDRVYGYLGRFVSYPSDEARVAHTAWIVHTHAMQLWESTPRIAFLSPEPGSGKSRALEVTETLVPRPMMVVNVSANYLFRKVVDEAGTPTVLFDEIDTVFGPRAREHEDVRGWLNAGHRKGAVAGRCVVRGKEVKTEDLPAYCAVAMAGLGQLPDTVMSRAIVIRMQRRHSGETVEAFRHRIHSMQALPIKMAIEAWVRSIPEIEEWPELPPQIQDRDADIWESLVALGDAAGSEWSARIRHAAVTLVTASKEREPSLGVRLLTDLRTIFGDAEQLQTNFVLERLIALDESPWADMRGKPLDARRLSKLLKEYDVKPRQLRSGDSQWRGYLAADLLEPWLRYLPPPPEYPSQASQTISATDVTDVTRPAHKGERCCRHCGTSGPNVLECAIGGETIRLHRNCIDSWTGSL